MIRTPEIVVSYLATFFLLPFLQSCGVLRVPAGAAGQFVVEAGRRKGLGVFSPANYVSMPLLTFVLVSRARFTNTNHEHEKRLGQHFLYRIH